MTLARLMKLEASSSYHRHVQQMPDDGMIAQPQRQHFNLAGMRSSLGYTKANARGGRQSIWSPNNIHVVTGAFGGIGKIVSGFLSQHGNIVRCGRNVPKGSGTEMEIRVQCDISAMEDIQQLFSHDFNSSSPSHLAGVHHSSGFIKVCDFCLGYLDAP